VPSGTDGRRGSFPSAYGRPSGNIKCGSHHELLPYLFLYNHSFLSRLSPISLACRRPWRPCAATDRPASLPVCQPSTHPSAAGPSSAATVAMNVRPACAAGPCCSLPSRHGPPRPSRGGWKAAARDPVRELRRRLLGNEILHWRELSHQCELPLHPGGEPPRATASPDDLSSSCPNLPWCKL
jgi:hypothetical protein